MGAKLVYLPFRSNGPQSVAFDSLSILHACFFSDVLLVLGSSGGDLISLARNLNKKVIFNQGGLDWQRSKWGPRTQKFLRHLERSAVKGADVLVCDNEGIADYFKEAYGRDSYLIEYGGDQISRPSLTEEHSKQYPYTQEPYAFSVARIQPDNNVEMILEGFSRTPMFPLVFIGNWASSDFGLKMKLKYGAYPNIHLLEAIYDPNLLNRFRGHCSIYVHGHSAGGTNPSLVEAMHLGLHIAPFGVVYNRATTEGKALYFNNSDELVTLVQTTQGAVWKANGSNMLEIAERRYRWSIIAGKYAEILR